MRSMESITFCIPFYGKEEKHTLILKTCVERIRLFYPNNPILICKTSDSLFPDLSMYSAIGVHNTFVDGSHVFGAIELLLRKCTTEKFLICHDSMFLLKELPSRVVYKELYALWHFKEQFQYFYHQDLLVKSCMAATKISYGELEVILEMGSSDLNRVCTGLFGPAFGGSIHTLKKVWDILNISEETIQPYLGRQGLMASERVFSVIFKYMGFDTSLSLNGDIYEHPGRFETNTIPPFENVKYPSSYFFKIWQGRV